MNLHSFRNTHLKRARLPIPPPGHLVEFAPFSVPRTRLELAPPYGDYPLKVACLPIPPPGQKGTFICESGCKSTNFFRHGQKKNSFFLPLNIQTSVSQWVLLFILCCHPSCNTNQNSTSNTTVSQKFIAAKGYRCPWRLQFCPNHSFSIILHLPPLPPCRMGRR